MTTNSSKAFSYSDSVYDFIFGSDLEDRRTADTAATVLRGMLPAIFVAVLLGSATYLFLTAPRTTLELNNGPLLQMEQKNIEIQTLDAFLKTDTAIIDREGKRLEELDSVGYATTFHDEKSLQRFLQRSHHNQLEASADLGTVTAYDDLGPDLMGKWAKEQEKLLTTELDTWQAAQRVAEVMQQYGAKSPHTFNAMGEFNHQRLLLLSSEAELKAYTDRMRPGLDERIESIRRWCTAQADYASMSAVVAHLSYHVLFVFTPLFLALATVQWLIGRLKRLSRKHALTRARERRRPLRKRGFTRRRQISVRQ
jgi:hypothetical protein